MKFAKIYTEEIFCKCALITQHLKKMIKKNFRCKRDTNTNANTDTNTDTNANTHIQKREKNTNKKTKQKRVYISSSHFI